MEERLTNNILLTVHIGAFIEMVKSLRLSVKYEPDDGGIYASVSEFRGSAYASSVEECNKELVHDMKDWAFAFASDFENWRLGRDDEIPYLLKVLLSSEEELLECLS